MKKRRLYSHLPFAFCLLTSSFSYSQSPVLQYAHRIVDTLASPYMHGRGYVLKGDSIAADYIKGEFEKFGVKPFENKFYQLFSFPVNTIYENQPAIFWLGPPMMYFKPGRDFLITPSSRRAHDIVHRPARTVWLDSTTFSDPKKLKRFIRKASGKYVIADLKKVQDAKVMEAFNKNKTPRGFIFLKYEKLTWNIAQHVDYAPSVQLLVKDSLDKIKETMNQKGHCAFMEFFNVAIPHCQSQNVLGFVKGTQYPDSFIVFSAHYDHLGMMGKDVYFPGANDNASGCAMLLNLAKYYSEHPTQYSVAFMAFSAEEVGLLGSKYYVEHPLFPLKQIKFLVNMDIMGTGDEGIKVVNATVHKKEFEELVKINDAKKLLPSVQPRGKAAISDHYFFEEAGVKTFFIYTLGGIKAYHDIYDRAETLPLTEFEDVFTLLTEFVKTF